VDPYIADIEAVGAIVASLNEVMVSRSRGGRSYTLCSTIPYHGGMPHAMMTERHVLSSWQVARHACRPSHWRSCYSVKEQSLHRMDDNWHNFCHFEVSVFRGFFFVRHAALVVCVDLNW
jgi:hypothetical protein